MVVAKKNKDMTIVRSEVQLRTKIECLLKDSKNVTVNMKSILASLTTNSSRTLIRQAISKSKLTTLILILTLTMKIKCMNQRELKIKDMLRKKKR